MEQAPACARNGAKEDAMSASRRAIAITGFVAAAAMPAGALADTISFNGALMLPAAGGEKNPLSSAVFSVPQFDPALGTLDAISYHVVRGVLDFSWTVDKETSGVGALTSPDPSARTSLHYFGGQLDTTTQDLSLGPPYQLVNGDSDGAPDFAGSDAHTFLGAFPLAELADTTVDPFLLSVFTGSGAVPLELRAWFVLVAGQPGPGIYAHDTTLSASAAQWFFQYEYTPAVIVDPGPGPSPVPEPATLSLVCLGAVALGLRQRRRRTAPRAL
jgi:hypothetical protein